MSIDEFNKILVTDSPSSARDKLHAIIQYEIANLVSKDDFLALQNKVDLFFSDAPSTETLQQVIDAVNAAEESGDITNLENILSQKANTSDLNNVITTLGTKANITDLSNLTDRVSTLESSSIGSGIVYISLSITNNIVTFIYMDNNTKQLGVNYLDINAATNKVDGIISKPATGYKYVFDTSVLSASSTTFTKIFKQNSTPSFNIYRLIILSNDIKVNLIDSSNNIIKTYVIDSFICSLDRSTYNLAIMVS